MTRAVLALVLVVPALALAAIGGAAPPGGTTQVIVTLEAPPLAQARGARSVAAARIVLEQRRFAWALAARFPDARIGWRYSLVANGMSVVLHTSHASRLGALPGVRKVFPAVTYSASAGPDATAIRARSFSELPLERSGEGIKIGVIDDGLDQRHPFFEPSGYVMPPGYPKGQTAYTTAKVIVARAFPPPGTTWKNARLPFDPEESGHATHVAGIAAGNAGTAAQGGVRISGIAPRAYLGNYKALTVPTDAGVGLDGNAPELVAAIEAAVADGMDVINLSLGEPEIDASRDVVALALDAASDAGVVPVVAAGNDFDEFGAGSLASPGSSAKAITVGAVSADASALAGFSAAGPTALSLRLKPDVVAPGSGILSSVPGGWGTLSGTSMAAPHVAGAAALLLQRHPDWAPARVKAAFAGTARPVLDGATPATPLRAGSGLLDVLAADRPLLQATPTSISLGFLRPGTTAAPAIALEDVGGGAGEWLVSVSAPGAPAGAAVTAPATVVVPGTLALGIAVTDGTLDGDVSGIVTLTRGGDSRRIAFWGRVVTPRLPNGPASVLARPGVFAGSTRGRPSLVTVYRYPELPLSGRIASTLAGPEQRFRVRIDRPVANFGVAIVRRRAGVRVVPRVVAAGDENRLTGYAGLPLNLNPYLTTFGDPTPVAGAIRPLPGTYDIVFDSPTPAGAGAFTFRFWIDDVTPPSVRLVTRTVRRGTPLRFRIGDAGAGIDPKSVSLRSGTHSLPVRIRGAELVVPTGTLTAGTKRLRVQLSDYQETRNMENVPRILPNTRVVTVAVRVLPRR